MDPQERNRAVECLKRTRDELIAAVQGLSESQMRFKPGPDRWSVADTLEHLAKSEDMVQRRVLHGLANSPAPPADHDRAKVDELMLTRIPLRTRKVEAPASVRPEGACTSAESLERFLASRAQSIATAEAAPGLREHAWDSPFGTKLDAYQWLLFNASHSERHTQQILELKSEADFPTK